MQSRERIRAALHGQPVDHTPFCPFLAYVWEFFPQEIRDMGGLNFHRSIGADHMERGAACAVKEVLPDELNITWKKEGDLATTQYETPVGTLSLKRHMSGSGRTEFLVEHPLKTEEDFKVQLWIEENTRFEYQPDVARDVINALGEDGLAVGMLIPRGKSAYQSLVEHYAGTEELIYALVDYPDTVETLWKTMVERDLEAARLSVQADYEYYLTFEDSSTQNYSPSQYDRYIGSEIGQWCDMINAAGKHYIQHACGHVDALVERMRDHGVFAVESLSPPPTGNLELKNARAKLSDSMGIIGGIEPTHFLDLTEDELVDYTRQVLADGAGGPFVMANSDSCPPGVTPEKFKLVAEVARRQVAG